MPQANPIVPEKLLRLVRSRAVRRGCARRNIAFRRRRRGVRHCARHRHRKSRRQHRVVEDVALAPIAGRRAGRRNLLRAKNAFSAATRSRACSRACASKIRTRCASCARAPKRKGCASSFRAASCAPHTTEDGRLVELRYSNAARWSSSCKADGDGLQRRRAGRAARAARHDEVGRDHAARCSPRPTPRSSPTRSPARSPTSSRPTSISTKTCAAATASPSSTRCSTTPASR